MKGDGNMENTVQKPLLQTSLLRMAWPIFIELLLQMLVGNIDQVMLSHYNETAVAAVVLPMPISPVAIIL